MARLVRGLVVAVAVTVSLLARLGAAKDFAVGGSMISWEVPPSNYAQLYNQWAEKNRFIIGDSLVFTYDAGKDSVLLVNKDAYDNCKTDTYIQSFKDGHTVVQLNHSGPFYFISGNVDNCKKHEKFVVVVVSERNKSAPSLPSPQPALAPSSKVPASSPPPPPSAPGGASPSPSPSDTSDMVPESDHKKKNGAPSTLLGALGSFGTFVGSFLVMVL